METGRLTVSISEIDEVKADEVINLTKKKRTLFGTLLAAALRSFWVGLTAPKTHGEVMDAEYAPVTEAAPTAPKAAGTEPEAPAAQPQAAAESEQKAEPMDEELNRFVNMFKLAREGGFTLKIVPGTPEENAPEFNFETETLQRPAA